MASTDLKHRGKLSFDDILKAESDNGIVDVDKKKLEQEFKMADINKDGFITPSEIEEVLWEQYYENPNAFEV